MIGDEDMEKPEEIEKYQYEREIEAVDLDTKESENTNTRPRKANVGKGVDSLEMKFGGGKYDTQFTTSTREKKKYFMHDMHKIAVDVTFTQMTVKKGINKWRESGGSHV